VSVLQKNKKVAAGIGVAAAAAAVLALGAGTYAAFSDTETAPDATFAAGTLNLTVGAPVAAPPVVWTNLAPGSTQTVTVQVDNAGTVDGNLSASFTATGTENGCAEPETDVETTCDDGSELLEQAQLWYGNAQVGTLGGGPFGPFPLFNLPATDFPTNVTFEVRVPTSAGNEIMTDTASMQITFRLDQA
jgi:predicted ribosomally synthesized peptide with SipW-like signal peptide